jgi:hypothetical protein
MSKQVWWKWPSGYYEKSWKPWYGIVWTLVTAPIVYVTFAAFYASVLVSVGINEAERIRKDLF